MKRSHLTTLILFGTLFLTYCSSTKKASAPGTATSFTYYDTDVSSLVESQCSPCHIPAKGGKKEALDTYENAKEHIDDILRRIQLSPGEKGFMPFKHPKLSDSAINVFKQWKANGLLKSK